MFSNKNEAKTSVVVITNPPEIGLGKLIVQNQRTSIENDEPKTSCKKQISWSQIIWDLLMKRRHVVLFYWNFLETSQDAILVLKTKP